MGNCRGSSVVWRNNGNGTFTVVDLGVIPSGPASAAIGTDYNNDRAVDLLVADSSGGTMFENPREGKFLPLHPFNRAEGGDRNQIPSDPTVGVTVLDFDHDGWMDVALTRLTAPALTLWRNNHGKTFDRVPLPETNWVRAYGVAAIRLRQRRLGRPGRRRRNQRRQGRSAAVPQSRGGWFQRRHRRRWSRQDSTQRAARHHHRRLRWRRRDRSADHAESRACRAAAQ